MEQESAITTTNTTYFGDLPLEIQVLVASFLTQHDLTVCLRVCRTWKTTFHQVLWRHVEITWDDNNMDRQDAILNALEVNGHLTHSLVLKEANGADFSNFIFYCPPTAFSRLVSAKVEGSFEMVSQETLDELIRLSTSGWKRLVLHSTGDMTSFIDFSPQPFEALLFRSSTLEVLRCVGNTHATGDQIDALLSSAPNLKVMSFYSRGIDSYNVPCMDAREIVRSEWVCANLEVFVCRIKNIPRPDITRDICGSPAEAHTKRGTIQESIDLQRQIYTKLAKLTKLRELRLGVPTETHHSRDKAYYRQFDCLAMTLESGLDLLKELKELRVVGLDDMEIYIEEREEQDWFHKQWPHSTITTTEPASWEG